MLRSFRLWSKKFQSKLFSDLKVSLKVQGKTIVNDLRFRDSNKDVLIQLADMVAGSIRRYYDKKGTDWSVYRKVLAKKEENVWRH